MIFRKTDFRWLTGVIGTVALVLFSAACGGDSDEPVAAPVGVTFASTGTTEYSAPGYSNDPVINFTAPVGTSYTITVEEGAKWCWTSRMNKTSTKTDIMVLTSQSDKIYLAANETADVRTARISVTFSTGDAFALTLNQRTEASTPPAAMDKKWAELPVYDKQSGLTVVTHFAPLSADKTARNYTLAYDTELCIARWVAYPIHDCYMQGTYNRSNAWAYDPSVPMNRQADLSRGSYNQKYGYIRGHQCMSNHRYVPYSTELNAQTFYSTNIMPQESQFNSGLWGSMEGVCSSHRCADTLYCVTGNAGLREYTYDKNGKKIAAPKYCFKVLLRTRSGRTGKRIDQITDASQLMAIGYWAENAASSNRGKLPDYVKSVAEIEELTGYTFFPMLDPAVAAEVKAQCRPSDWGIN